MAQLDHRHDANANSIGLLLLHMAAVEVAGQQMTFHGRNYTTDPGCLAGWDVALFMGPPAWETVRGRPLEDYMAQMAAIRQATLAALQGYDDAWLWRECHWKRGIVVNHSWMWYHVCEDEMGHRGEINWPLSRLPAG